MPESPPDLEQSAAEIRRVLDGVIASPVFSKSNQLANFLRFVVEETLAGRGSTIKAYTIAIDALGRDAGFDPQVDPIVRVEAARLRRALECYYASEGRHDPITIELPVGHYTPVFRRNDKRRKIASQLADLWRPWSQTLHANYRLILVIVFVVTIVSFAVHLIGLTLAGKI